MEQVTLTMLHLEGLFQNDRFFGGNMMIKKKKKNNPKIGEIYALHLIDKSLALGQICHMKEVEGYYSLTMAFFEFRFKTIECLRSKLATISFSNPVFVCTVADNPLKDRKGILVGEGDCKYENVSIEDHITGTWGWYDKIERDTNWILEMYFGVCPWDTFGDPLYMDKLLIQGQKMSHFARTTDMFSTDELAKLFGAKK
jgi:hypothetical protein